MSNHEVMTASVLNDIAGLRRSSNNDDCDFEGLGYIIEDEIAYYENKYQKTGEEIYKRFSDMFTKLREEVSDKGELELLRARCGEDEDHY